MNNTNVSARRMAWGSGRCLVILEASAISALVALNCSNEDVCRVLTNLLYLTRESNIPTWYSTGLWAIAGLIALLISLVTPLAQRVLRWQ